MLNITPRNDTEKHINDLEMKIYNMNKEIQALLKDLPGEEITNYQLESMSGEKVSLLNLFGDKEEMILIHNMSTKCSYCTMWADEINGVLPYLQSRTSVVLENEEDPILMDEFSRDRKWNFFIVSSRNTTLKQDMGFKTNEGNQPGFSTLYRENGRIYRHRASPFGPGDNYSSVWHNFDRLRSGVGSFQPNDYRSV